MAKGYWMARVDVADAERYKDYVAANAAAFAKYGARFLVRGGRFADYPGGHAEGFPDTFKQLYKAIYHDIQHGKSAEPLYATFADGHRPPDQVVPGMF